MNFNITDNYRIGCLLMIGFALNAGSTFAQDQRPVKPQRPRPESTDRLERAPRESGEAQRQERPNNRRDFMAIQIDAQRREELRSFVRENLPEFERVLGALHDRHPAQFQRALISINESYSRLQELKKRGSETAYQNALENWKIDAQIKMVSAQLSFREDAALENQLKRLVNRQIDNRIANLHQEKARLQRQLERMDANLSRLESDRETEVDRRINVILKTSERLRAQAQNKTETPGLPDRPKTDEPPGRAVAPPDSDFNQTWEAPAKDLLQTNPDSK
jgi:uncharacterized small protein (DUF1192 family)